MEIPVGLSSRMWRHASHLQHRIVSLRPSGILTAFEGVLGQSAVNCGAMGLPGRGSPHGLRVNRAVLFTASGEPPGRHGLKTPVSRLPGCESRCSPLTAGAWLGCLRCLACTGHEGRGLLGRGRKAPMRCEGLQCCTTPVSTPLLPVQQAAPGRGSNKASVGGSATGTQHRNQEGQPGPRCSPPAPLGADGSALPLTGSQRPPQGGAWTVGAGVLPQRRRVERQTGATFRCDWSESPRSSRRGPGRRPVCRAGRGASASANFFTSVETLRLSSEDPTPLQSRDSRRTARRRRRPPGPYRYEPASGAICTGQDSPLSSWLAQICRL